ncbi:hypothetical protein HY732_04125 [Candidatus Uhrbacteria bacterium]|nr:hypothetical protein [Candidatus Uhrbacteria bacterium]
MAKTVDSQKRTGETSRDEMKKELELLRSSLANALGGGRIVACDQPYALHIVGAIEKGEEHAWDSDRLVEDSALTEERLKRDPSNGAIQEELDRLNEALLLLEEKEKNSDYYRFIASEATTLDVIDDARLRMMRRRFDSGDRSMFDGLSREGDTEQLLSQSGLKDFLSANGGEQSLSDAELVKALHIFLGAKEAAVSSRATAFKNKGDQSAERKGVDDSITARFAIRNLKDTVLRKIAGEDPQKQKEFLEKHYGVFSILDQQLRGMIEKEAADRKYEGDATREIMGAAWNYIQDDWKKTDKGVKLLALATISGTVGAVAATVIAPLVAQALLHTTVGAGVGMAVKLGGWFLPYRIGRSALTSGIISGLLTKIPGVHDTLEKLDAKISSAIDPFITGQKIKKATKKLPAEHSVEESKNALLDKQEKDCAKEAESFVAVRGIKRFLAFVGKHPLRTGLSALLGYELATHVDASTLASLEFSSPAEAATLSSPKPEPTDARNPISFSKKVTHGASIFVGTVVREHAGIKLTPANVDSYSSVALRPEDSGKAIFFVSPEWNKLHGNDSVPTHVDTPDGKIYEMYKVSLVDVKTHKGIIQEPFVKTADGKTFSLGRNGKLTPIHETKLQAPESKKPAPVEHPSAKPVSTPKPETISRDSLPKVEMGKQVEFTKERMVYFLSNEDWKKYQLRAALLPPGQKVTWVSSAWLAQNRGSANFSTPVIVVDDYRSWDPATFSGPQKGAWQALVDKISFWKEKLPTSVEVKQLDKPFFPPKQVMKPWVAPDHGAKQPPRPVPPVEAQLHGTKFLTAKELLKTGIPTPSKGRIAIISEQEYRRNPHMLDGMDRIVIQGVDNDKFAGALFKYSNGQVVGIPGRSEREFLQERYGEKPVTAKPAPKPTPESTPIPRPAPPSPEPTAHPTLAPKPAPSSHPSPAPTPEHTPSANQKQGVIKASPPGSTPAPKPFLASEIPTPKTGKVTIVAPAAWHAAHAEFGTQKTVFTTISNSNAPYAIMKFPDGKMLYWNDAAHTWHGYKPAGVAAFTPEPLAKKPQIKKPPLAQPAQPAQPVQRQSSVAHISRAHEVMSVKMGRIPEDHALLKFLGHEFGGEVRKTLGLPVNGEVPPKERGALLTFISNLRAHKLIGTDHGRVVLKASPDQLRHFYEEARATDHSTADKYAEDILSEHWREWFGGEEHQKKGIETKGKAPAIHERKAPRMPVGEQQKIKVRVKAPEPTRPVRISDTIAVDHPVETPKRAPIKGLHEPFIDTDIDAAQRGAYAPAGVPSRIFPGDLEAIPPVATATVPVVPTEPVVEQTKESAPKDTPPPLQEEARQKPVSEKKAAPPKEREAQAEPAPAEKGIKQKQPSAEGKPTTPPEEILTEEQRYVRLLLELQKNHALPSHFMENVAHRTVGDFTRTISTMLDDAKKTHPGELNAFLDEGSLSPLLKNSFARSLDRQDFVLSDRETTSVDYHHLVLLDRLLDDKRPTLQEGSLEVKDFFLKKGL